MIFISWVDDIQKLFISDEKNAYKICFASDINSPENYLISSNYSRFDWKMGYPQTIEFNQFCELLKELKINFTLKTEYQAIAAKIDLKPLTNRFDLPL